MRVATYAAARDVAADVHAHFLHRHQRSVAQGESPIAPVPDPASIAAILDAAFWASLKKEEGVAPKISLAWIRPEQTEHPLVFAHAIALDPAALTRIAPAVERRGIHLGVCDSDGELRVWGTVRDVPRQCCIVEVSEPGVIVVKRHRGDPLAKLANVVVLQGDEIKIIDENASTLPDCPELLTSLLGLERPRPGSDSLNILVELAVSMRAHRHGGLLLVVPSGTDRWRESLLAPLGYAVSPPFAELAMLSRGPTSDAPAPAWREQLGRAVDAVAGLTAVDGATIVSADYELHAFGAKIARRRGAPPVERLTMTEPVRDWMPAVVAPGSVGGTRHLSAAQFVHDQQDALALVASQDGRFTIFAWSPCEDMVHAHRIETLLL
jgi:hypothetical protein